MKAMQPYIVTNYVAGTVSLRILIGAKEETFEFQTTRWRDGLALKHYEMNEPAKAPVNALADSLVSLLKAMGYEPIVEHKT